jgi:hypothetical protein
MHGERRPLHARPEPATGGGIDALFRLVVAAMAAGDVAALGAAGWRRPPGPSLGAVIARRSERSIERHTP